MNRLLIAAALGLRLATVLPAENPAITDTFTADPATIVHDGTVYLYAGHDAAPGDRPGYVMNEWLCYSSTDLVHWESHGSPLAPKDFSWANGSAWAGHVIEKEGRFFWYVTVEHATIHGKAIGVAVADSPTGPFHDARGSALVTNDMTKAATISWDDIDPAAFIDDDGQAWLFWGNTKCYYARLKANMIELDGPIRIVSPDLPGFTEAPWVHKREDTYYLTYAHGFPERTAYATAPSISGPWTYRGLLAEVAGNSNTIHQAILDYRGRSYFVYHNGAGQSPDTGGSFRRSVCIDNLEYGPDGAMKRVVQTTEGVAAVASPGAAPAAGFPNPLVPRRADPWVHRHDDGFYYFTATVPEYDRLELRRAATLEGLATAEPRVIWRKHPAGPMGAHIWAPELHHIDGKWFIYFAAGGAEKVWDIRMYALENPSPNPLEGDWTERGQIKTNWESFSLDATSFAHRGHRYLVWAQHDPKIGGNTNLYIARMSGPASIAGRQVMITTPEHDWETIRFRVNEGAAVLQRHGKVFITYSAAGTGAEYCMGMLTADAGADLLDPESWHKSPRPVFQTSAANGIFGPGHNCFTTTPDGRTDILVYHARSYRDIQGDPLHDPNRHTRVQPFAWKADGTPFFGAPRPESAPARPE